MPQYYEGFFNFTKTLVAIFIRDVVSTGAVNLEEFSSIRYSVRCTLSGNLCTTSCPKLPEQGFCKRRQVEVFCYTLGVTYCLFKLFETQKVYHKDFETVIHTGKRYIEYLQDWEPYDLLDTYEDYELFDSLTNEESKDITRRIFTYDKLEKFVLEYFNKQTKESLEKNKELIEKFKKRHGKVPSSLLTITKNLEQGLFDSLEEVSFTSLQGLIFKFIQGDLELESSLLFDLVKFLVLDFKPTRPDDFPLNQIKSIDSKIYNLIEQTRSFSDDNPRKWTEERIDRLKQETDPYKKLTLFNDNLYAWYLYIFPKDVLDLKTEYVKVKFLLDSILQRYSPYFTTNFIIINWMELDKVRRFVKVINTFRYLNKELGLKFSSFFTEKLLSNQFQLKSKEINGGDFMPLILSIDNTYFPDDVDKIREILHKHNLIRRFIIIKDL